MANRATTDEAAKEFTAHLLDVGKTEYGDCYLCQFRDDRMTVLIDGAHPGDDTAKPGYPSIPDQLRQLLGQEGPTYQVTLLVVTHCHNDHIGCLPALVEQGILKAEWALLADPDFGWGRNPDAPDDAAVDESIQRRVRSIMAALREESRADDPDDVEIERFLDAAARLEDRYRDMIKQLQQDGTRVFLYGRDNIEELEEKFSPIGLKILGPDEEHLRRCTEYIQDRGRDAIGHVQRRLDQIDQIDEVAAYRMLAASNRNPLDSLDSSGVSAAINNQSIVMSFDYGGRKVLFTGDMQFAEPGVGGLEDDMKLLRKRIRENGPYAFVKIAHHGSYNAFDKTVLEDLPKTQLFGISTGAASPSHPDGSVLQLLEQYRLKVGNNRIKWARTDRNGLVTFTFGEKIRVGQPARGKLNDARVNSVDVERSPVPTGTPTEVIRPSTGTEIIPREQAVTLQQPTTTERVGAGSGDGQDQVEIIARIPHTATRVTITVDVQPQGPTPAPVDTRSHGSALPQLQIAGGRKLPPLLFVTNREELTDNIGRLEAESILQSLREQGQTVFDELPRGLTDAVQATRAVREQLMRHPEVQGVVLIGGYDVVPAQKVNVVTPELRRHLYDHRDPDDFLIWSDDDYGTRGDNGQRIPVSRIPDARDPNLVRAAIEATNSAGARRYGIRNVRRPFADEVFNSLPGEGVMLASEPTMFNQESPRLNLAADRVYLMLHGDYDDLTYFSGEAEEGLGYPRAVHISNVPEKFSGTVFTGCCWGALIVDRPAALVVSGAQPAARTANASLALSFLKAGALAFVGCTGAHYSPVEQPFDYYGAPMHRAFWRFLQAGLPPARALFQAKGEYVRGIGRRRSSSLDRAIELKILAQYTCLGLGW